MQNGLVVQPIELAGSDFEPFAEQPRDQRLRGFHPTVEIDRTEHRLERVGQDRRLLPTAGGVLTLAQQQPLAQADRLGHFGQRSGVHHALAKVGELALGKIAVTPIGDLGDDPSEHRIAEELEAFVRRLTSHLCAPRAVSKGSPQQRQISELVTQTSAERREAASGVGGAHASRTRS